jgi:hypothetical protein
MTSERDMIVASIADHPFASIITERYDDSVDEKVIRITDDVSIALKRALPGSDPLSIINHTGSISYLTYYLL